MDDQPRHQHRSPSAASHRTIARRPPAPFAAHRARRQRQLKAHLPRPHPTRYLRTDDPPIISGGGRTPQFHQQHLYKRSLRGSALSHRHGRPTQERRHRTIHGRPTQERRHRTIYKILATGQRFGRKTEGRLSTVRTFGEFKGCLRHSSKGGS